MSNQNFVWETHEQIITARPAGSWEMHACVSLTQPGKKCLRFNEGDINKYQKMKKPTHEVTSAGAEVFKCAKFQFKTMQTCGFCVARCIGVMNVLWNC